MRSLVAPRRHKDCSSKVIQVEKMDSSREEVGDEKKAQKIKDKEKKKFGMVVSWMGKVLHLSSSSSKQRKASGTPRLPSLVRKGGKVVLGEFQLQRCIGKGSFGQVFVATRASQTEDMLYAVKVLDKADVVARKQVDHTLTEREIMAKFANHPFLLGLVSSFQTSSKLCLVSEFCGGGEMFYHLDKVGRFTEEMAQYYCAQACDALIYLHENGIAYRDLKSENMLLDCHGRVKLGDFGLSKIGVQEQTGARTICGSLHYMAPEMILCHRSQRWRGKCVQSYGFMADWWTFGNLLYDMLVGQPAFIHPNKAAMFERIVVAHELSFPACLKISSAAKDLIRGMLTRNPEKRLGSVAHGGLHALYNHPFFHGVDWERLRQGQVRPPMLPSCHGLGRSVSRTNNNNNKSIANRASGEDRVQENAEAKLNALLRNFDNSFTNTAITGALQRRKNPRVALPDHDEIQSRFLDWDLSGPLGPEQSPESHVEPEPVNMLLVA